MWGAACDMDAIMDIAARRDLIVIEDACQGVGGGYEGRKFGSIGHIGAFSFNYYKNMTARRRRRRRRQRRRHRQAGRAARSTPATSTGTAATTSEALRRQRRARLRADGRDAQRPARPPRRHDLGDAGREEAILAGTALARQSRPEADADEQPRPRLRDAGHVHAAVSGGGDALRRDLPERHRRQDRPPHLHRMGPGADAAPAPPTRR